MLNSSYNVKKSLFATICNVLAVGSCAALAAASTAAYGADRTRLGPDSPLALQIAGAAFETTEGNVTTVPESATAASLNITVVNPEGEGYLTVWPCGVARPLASNLNFTAGAVVPNGVLASLGADGSVCLFSSAPTDVLVDVSGWFDGEAFEGSTPTRLVDTREGRGAPLAPTTPSTPVSVPVASLPVSGALGTAKTIPTAVSAVALNVTVVNPSAAGFVTVWPCGEARPNASNLNFEAGQVVANGVIAPVGGNGSVCAFSSVPTDLIVDLAGWFPGDLFSGTTPTRLLDSRGGGASKLGAGGIAEVAILGTTLSGGSAVPATARAVSLNVTVTGADAPGYLTVWPCGLARPNASNVNFVAGQTVANNVLAPMDGSGKICVFSSAPTHVIVDVAGWVNAETQAAAFAGAISKRMGDTRTDLWLGGANQDSDRDGVPDFFDDFPLNADLSGDTDGDGLIDLLDPDDDGDGILDALDDLPFGSGVAGNDSSTTETQDSQQGEQTQQRTNSAFVVSAGSVL